MELLFSKCDDEVLLRLDRDGHNFVEKAAIDHCISLIPLFHRPNGERLYSPNVLKFFAKNFSKHLSHCGNKVFGVFELLSKCHMKVFSRESLLQVPCIHYALDSFSLTHFWTFSVAPKVIRYFVGFGFDINLRDENGRTVLHWAYASGKEKIITLCLELNADENVKDNNGVLPAQNKRSVKKWQSVNTSGSFK